MKKIINFIILLILLSSCVNAQSNNIKIVNSTLGEVAKVKVYQIITINEDLDYTINTFYIQSNNATIQLKMRDEREFHIFDFEVQIDGEPYTFVPRPSVGSEFINGKEVFFFEPKKISLEGNHFIEMTYKIDNIETIRSSWWYPFDKYTLFFQNISNIPRNTSMTISWYYPKTFVKMEGSVNATVETRVKCPGLSDTINLNIYPDLLSRVKYLKMSPEVCVLDNELTGIKLSMTNLETNEKTSCKIPENETISIKPKVIIERAEFPAKYFFIIFVIFFIVLSYTTFHKTEKFVDYVSMVYEKGILPFIVAELTIALSGVQRPLTLTLLDSLILIPLILYFVFQYNKENKPMRFSGFKKNIKNEITKEKNIEVRERQQRSWQLTAYSMVLPILLSTGILLQNSYGTLYKLIMSVSLLFLLFVFLVLTLWYIPKYSEYTDKFIKSKTIV